MSVGRMGCLLFITDTDSGRHFLYDIGAPVIVLPASTLSAADGLSRLFEFPGLTEATFSSTVTKHVMEPHIISTGPLVYALTQHLYAGKFTMARA